MLQHETSQNADNFGRSGIFLGMTVV